MFMRRRLDSRGRTFTDVACRSEDVLFSVGSRLGAGLSGPDLASSGVLRGFGRTTEILNGMTVMTWLPRSTECAAPGISQAKDVL